MPSILPTELVHTRTSDGLRLDGALHAPQRQTDEFAVDALLLLPGVGSNFYAAGLLEQLTPPLLEAGLAVLRANTRGRDGFYMTRAAVGVVREGAAFEIVDDCRKDLDAWASFLSERGLRRLGVLGHSLGAIKAVYGAAMSKKLRWRRVIAASPPRLSFSLFQTGPRADVFRQAMDEATALVEQERDDELFLARFPFPLLISAKTYVDKYGPAERYDILKHAGRLATPSLFTYGEVELREGGVAFVGMDEAVRTVEVEPGCQQPHAIVVEGADHFYSQHGERLAEIALEWLRQE